MTAKKTAMLVLTCMAVFCFFAEARGGQKKNSYRAVFHIHTAFSHKGKLSLAELSALLSKNNIDAAVLADDAVKKWRWGMPPWRNIFKKQVSLPAVFDAGIENYLRSVELENLKNENVLLIPGLQANAHYYWRGNPFQKEWELVDANKDMVLTGLKNVSDWAKIPVIHNTRANTYSVKSLIFMWPFLIIAIAAGYIFSGNRSTKPAALLLLVIAAFFAADYFPYTHISFSQYDSSAGERPFQVLIDYVKAADGLIFWSHPESYVWKEKKMFKNLTIKNNSYTASLKNTSAYTGFGYFQEGSKETGIPGGIWDEVLMEYCSGSRPSGVWAVGELDLTAPGANDAYLKSLDNIIYADKLSEESLLGALRKGSFYVRSLKSSDIVVSGIKLESGALECGLGEKLDCGQNSVVRYSVKIEDKNLKSAYADVVLVKNKKVEKKERISLPGGFSHASAGPKKGKMDYYRLEIKSPDGSHVVLNPIFVVRG